MAELAKGIVGGQMAWGLIAIGAAFGIALIACGARSVMLVAVGLYLPFETDSAIFAGGLLRWVTDRFSARRDEAERAEVEERGTLLASGLIAGEAIMGILLAVMTVANWPSLTRLVTGGDRFSFFDAWGNWLSLIGFAALGWVLIRIPLGKRATRS